MSKLPAALQPTEEDIQTLLAAQVHLGSKVKGALKAECRKQNQPKTVSLFHAIERRQGHGALRVQAPS